MITFEQYCIDAHGVKGEQWLHALPELIKKISAIYNLSSLKPLPNLSYNCVSRLSGRKTNSFKIRFR